VKNPVLALVLSLMTFGCSDDSTSTNNNPDDGYIWFSGRRWEKIAKVAGPGPNRFLKENVFVTGSGDGERLHLKMKQDQDAVWSCAELRSVDFVGYGEYTFQVEGPNVDGLLNGLDGSLVVGFFTWDNDQEAFQKMGNTEIDIEFAKWGKGADEWNTLLYSVQPTNSDQYIERRYKPSFPMMLLGGGSTHKFVWTPTGVKFTSYRGYGPIFSDIDKVGEWEFTEQVARSISQDGRQKPSDDESGKLSDKIVLLTPTANTRIHINLWLFQGKPPQTNKPFELVLKKVEYKPLVDLTAGLVAYYPLDGNANDASGNGKNGTVYGSKIVNGKSSQAYEFNGSSDYIDLGSIGQTNELTISAWVYVYGSTGTFQAVVSSEDAPPWDVDNMWVHFQLNTFGNIAVFVNTHDCILLPILLPSPYNTWRHIALSCKSGEMCVYENGILKSKNTSTYQYIRGARKVRIGSGNEKKRYFNGVIDEVRIYNRALSADEVRRTMN